MFRRTGKALAKYKELRQKKKDLARARSTVTTDGKAGAGAGAGAATSGSVTSKRDTDRAPKKRDDDTDDFLEWQANEKRNENIRKKSLRRHRKEQKLSCREMMKEPEAHVSIGLVLTLHFFFYLFHTWRSAAMSQDSGLPEAARADIVNSQGLQLVSSVGHWVSIFAVFCYFIEQFFTLFFDGVTAFFTSSRLLDFLLWCVASVASFYGAAHSPLFNVPRILWRIYMVCSAYLERATASTTYYRNKVIKLNTLAKHQRKTMMEMNVAAEQLKATIEQQKNHVSELERALLIAAESEAVRMDLSTLSQYAKEGANNKDDFAY